MSPGVVDLGWVGRRRRRASWAGRGEAVYGTRASPVRLLAHRLIQLFESLTRLCSVVSNTYRFVLRSCHGGSCRRPPLLGRTSRSESSQ